MAVKLFDSYHYCSDEDKGKEKFYRRHQPTEEEQQVTDAFQARMKDFVKKVDRYGMKTYEASEQGRIQFFQGIGYISINNYDRDEVLVFLYGKTEDESFENAIVEYELYTTENYEWSHRKELQADYSRRFKNGEDPEEYHGPFFFSELTLQDLRKYFGDNIPKHLVEKYEKHASEIEGIPFQYDYPTNQFVKQKTR